MDLNKLRAQRRLNVQEQLVLKKHNILLEAKYWRENGISEGLKSIFTVHQIDFETSILLEYSQDYPGISTDVGIILTAQKRFFEFDADLSPDRKTVIQLYSWKDVSDNFETENNKKGSGKTYGLLAIEVLNELNGVVD